MLSLAVANCRAEILVENGQLTVQVDGMAVGTILDEIGKQGNILIKKDEGALDQKVTIQFGPLPLDKGLKRLQEKINYLATYDQLGNITWIAICGKESGQSPKSMQPNATSLIPPEETVPQPEVPSEPQESNAAPPDPMAAPIGN